MSTHVVVGSVVMRCDGAFVKTALTASVKRKTLGI